MSKLYKVSPLSATFSLTSIVGFLVSAFFIYPKLSEAWGFTFMVFFVITFIASMVSATKAELDDDHHMEELAVHEKWGKK